MTLSLERRTERGSASADVVVVGAGPYGLSAAAHLSQGSLKVAIFGKPMCLWREHIPKGMLLRSYWWATNLSDPQHHYGLERYAQETNQELIDPLPGAVIAEYGLWFQRHAVPQVDQTYVKLIEWDSAQFRVTLADGRTLTTRAVVMAPGLHYYAYRPAAYAHLPPEVASHTFDHHTLDQFTGQRVAVIGGGQSALETAALLYEKGIEAHLVNRHSIRWLTGNSMTNRTLIRRLTYPKAGIAPGWFNWGLEHMPLAFHQLPRAAKDQLLRGHGSYGPAGAHWLKPRIQGHVVCHDQQQVLRMKETHGAVTLTLSGDGELEVDHVLLATGYHVDIKRLRMLHPALLAKVQTYQDAPVLNSWFESSVPHLYFLGMSSLLSHGPLNRFVVGTDAAARRAASAVATAVARQPVYVSYGRS
ncbi:MAG: NAD(P)-binding domain-containing protein [Ktedonobacterales bacterium]